MSPSAIVVNGTSILAKTWGETDMTGGKGEEFGKAVPFGLLLILLLLIAVIFLVRSMNRRLRNLPESFDDLPQDSGRSAHAMNNASPMDDALPSSAAGPAETEATGDTATLVADEQKPNLEK